MIRWFQLIILAAGVMVVVQAVLLALGEPIARRRFAAELQTGLASPPVEQRLLDWRRRLRRRLWINIVAVPCLVLLALVLVGEFG